MSLSLPIQRVGIYATRIVVVILCLFMVRNCANALYYGATTSDQAMEQYYMKGFQDGLKEGQVEDGKPGENIMNPLLRKNYEKGFRDGRDSKRKERGKHHEKG